MPDSTSRPAPQVTTKGESLGTLGTILLGFEWPYEIPNGKWLLYPTEILVNGNDTCHPPGGVINPLNLTVSPPLPAGPCPCPTAGVPQPPGTARALMGHCPPSAPAGPGSIPAETGAGAPRAGGAPGHFGHRPAPEVRGGADEWGLQGVRGVQQRIPPSRDHRPRCFLASGWCFGPPLTRRVPQSCSAGTARCVWFECPLLHTQLPSSFSLRARVWNSTFIEVSPGAARGQRWPSPWGGVKRGPETARAQLRSWHPPLCVPIVTRVPLYPCVLHHPCPHHHHPCPSPPSSTCCHLRVPLHHPRVPDHPCPCPSPPSPPASPGVPGL